MYDNIKTVLYVDTLQNFNNEAFTQIKERFSMDIENRKTGTCANGKNSTLAQNKGIYIAFCPTTHNSPAHYSIEFSLHKFYNVLNGNKLQNYDKFTFADSKNAFSQMVDFMLDVSPVLDMTKAVVKTFEVGINLQLLESADNYMKELSHFEVGAKKVRILENPKYKEYKVYSTHSDSNKRSVFIFYDKTTEVNDKDRKDIHNAPQNLMRLEKDNKRPATKLFFDDSKVNGIFNEAFIQATFKDFAEHFTKNLRFKETAVKDNTTYKQIEIDNLVKEFGKVGIFTELSRRYKAGAYNQRYYYRFKQEIEMFLNTAFEVKTVESERTKYFKSLLLQKINEFKP